MREEPQCYKVLIMILTIPVFLLNSQPNSHHIAVPEGSAMQGTMNEVKEGQSLRSNSQTISHVCYED